MVINHKLQAPNYKAIKQQTPNLVMNKKNDGQQSKG